MKKFQIFILLFVAFIFGACSSKDVYIAKNTMYNNTQNYAHYHTHTTALKPDLDQNVNQLPKVKNSPKIRGDKFLDRYFRAWSSVANESAKKSAFWGVNAYQNKPNRKMYRSDGAEFSDSFFVDLKANANENGFGEISHPALTLHNTYLRNSPTNEALFSDPKDPNNNIPFDNLANSLLGANQPIFVSHFTLDKKFALVASDAVWGWVNASDIQIIDESVQNAFKNAKFITIIKDKTPILSQNAMLDTARIGNLFIKIGENDENFVGKFYTKNGFENFEISKQTATNFPAQINSYNVKTAINSILGEPYGWGGYGKYRDCSLYTKDLMAGFGLWLPRNSKAQANVGKIYNLAGMSDEEKLDFISKNGVPYFTLLFFPGHIMLYTGEVRGEPTITHSIWGLKTEDDSRALIAKNALTTLKVGEKNHSIPSSRLILTRIQKMAILTD